MAENLTTSGKALDEAQVRCQELGNNLQEKDRELESRYREMILLAKSHKTLENSIESLKSDIHELECNSSAKDETISQHEAHIAYQAEEIKTLNQQVRCIGVSTLIIVDCRIGRGQEEARVNHRKPRSQRNQIR